MNIAQLRDQQANGFRQLRFEPELERHYRSARDEGIRARARPVSASALALFLIYTLLDSLMLPPAIARDTIAVRLLITCPVIIGVWWLSYSKVHADHFVRAYALAYLLGGLSVVGIIGIARTQSHPLPYEGILLMLMFGYFVMGIPFRTVSGASLLVIVAYLWVEYATGTTARQLMINGFFVGTANIIGMVGSWLSEHRQRAHFLDRQMLNASKLQAEQENHRKTRLITVASHDLRQPLNVISLILENLTADGLPGEQKALVARLKTSVSHFNGLLASVLDISRIQEGMVVPEPAPLCAWQAMQLVAETCGEQSYHPGVEVKAHRPGVGTGVLADPQLLHRVLQNLVVNALEHSDANQIDLRATHQHEQICFEVRDNGRGIDEDTLKQIFTPFFRRDPHKRSCPGLGLGLAIVRELTELMDGHCSVQSNPGEGACFRVFLPAIHAPQVSNGGPQSADVSAGVPPVLVVVEDHEEARYWICETLVSWGYHVQDAENAEQAIARFDTSSNAILVSDVHLPGMSGDALYDQLSTNRSVLGGILMTADTAIPQGYNPERRLWVLHKPLVPMRLRAAITQLIRPPAEHVRSAPTPSLGRHIRYGYGHQDG